VNITLIAAPLQGVMEKNKRRRRHAQLNGRVYEYPIINTNMEGFMNTQTSSTYN